MAVLLNQDELHGTEGATQPPVGHRPERVERSSCCSPSRSSLLNGLFIVANALFLLAYPVFGPSLFRSLVGERVEETYDGQRAETGIHQNR